jgi:hypothetical protein
VKLVKRVDIDEHYFFKGAPLVIGYSAVTYQRTVPRKSINLRRL